MQQVAENVSEADTTPRFLDFVYSRMLSNWVLLSKLSFLPNSGGYIALKTIACIDQVCYFSSTIPLSTSAKSALNPSLRRSQSENDYHTARRPFSSLDWVSSIELRPIG
jgi:hypothetical protein